MIVCFEGIDGCGKSTQAKKLVEYINNRCIEANKKPIAIYFSITDFVKEVIATERPIEALSKYNFNYDIILKSLDTDKTLKACLNVDKILKLLKTNGHNSYSSYLFDQLATGYLEVARCLFKVLSIHDNKNMVIVLDRWVWSTIAYNAAKEGTIFNKLLDKDRNDLEDEGSKAILTYFFHKVVRPDLTIYFDINKTNANKQRKKRGDIDPVLENTEYQANVQKAFNRLLNKRTLCVVNDNTLVISAYPDIDKTINVNDMSIEGIRKDVIEIFKEYRI